MPEIAGVIPLAVAPVFMLAFGTIIAGPPRATSWAR